MSASNGDKARFNRERKKKIARRARYQATLSMISQNPLSKPARRVSEQEGASA